LDGSSTVTVVPTPTWPSTTTLPRLLVDQLTHAGQPEARAAAVVLGKAPTGELIEDGLDVVGVDAPAVGQ
jgi:hypothetical protein